MNIASAVLVAGIAAFMMPWARANHVASKRKVVIRSYAYQLYKKYQSNRSSSVKNSEQTNHQHI